jgi:hypothetical protein
LALLREAKGDLELDDLNQVPYLRITQPLLDCLDFTSFENKEGMGSLYDRHRERVRSVDKLIGKWDGTTWLFIRWCMRVCTIFNGPDFYTVPLLSTFV